MKKRNTSAHSIRLNLGCGKDHRPGYINIDAVKEVKPNLVHTLPKPLPFLDGSVSHIVAQDILEHFIYDDFLLVMSEISRVLQKDGEVSVRVPNIDRIIQKFQTDKEVRNIFLYGGTSQRTDTGIFGAHKIGFSAQRLIAELMVFGLHLKSINIVDTNTEAVFIKKNPPELSKIVLFIQSLSMGGAEQFTVNLLSQFSKKESKIFSYTNNKFVRDLLLKNNVSTADQIGKIPWVVDLLGNWKGLLKSVFTFPLSFFWYGIMLSKHKDADVILVSGFSEKMLASFWAWFFDIGLVWIEFGPLTSCFKKHLKLSKVLYRFAKQFPQRVIVPSQVTFNALIGEARVSLSKLVLIPCGIATVKRSKSMVASKGSMIVCVSRLEKGKGQDLLLRAFSLVRKKLPEARLLIIGEGSFLSRLIELTHALHLEKAVSFLGYVDDVRPYVEQATVVAFPSVWDMEGFGLVAVEAMAQKKPLVAFDRAPIHEIVQAEKTGLLVPVGEIRGFAQALMTILSSKEMQKSFGLAGMKRFQQEYRIEYVADLYKKQLLLASSWKKAEKILKNMLAD